MKKLFIALMGFFMLVGVAKAQNPFVYTETMEWSKVDTSMQKQLLKYANAGKRGGLVTQYFDSVTKVVMVKNIKSRSGKVEDQIWVQGVDGAYQVNYLFSLDALPSYSVAATGKLAINGHRGDSDEMESEDDGW